MYLLLNFKKTLLFIFFIIVTIHLHADTVYLVPFGNHDPHLFFFNPFAFRDEISKPFCCLRQELERAGYTIKITTDGADLDNDFTALISVNEISDTLLENLSEFPKERCFFIALDPPIVLPYGRIYDREYSAAFGHVFVMFDDLIDNSTYYKFYYPQPRLQMLSSIPKFNQKKLCTLIACNRDYGFADHPKVIYPARKKIIQFFETLPPGEFDLFGLFWEGYRDWKGPITHKWSVLKNYKFSICYENTKDQSGYITEKIFDSFVGGCVPVYWGADNIMDYIPKTCFIDRRDFESDEELYYFMKKMDRKTYKGYLKSINNYLKSPAAQLFSINHFVEIIMQEISKNN